MTTRPVRFGDCGRAILPTMDTITVSCSNCGQEFRIPGRTDGFIEYFPEDDDIDAGELR